MADDSFTSTRTINSDDLARLKRDREAVDRKFYAALTALDRAVQQLPPLADPPPPPDDTQIDPLNSRWSLIPDHEPEFGSGLRAHVGFVRLTLRAAQCRDVHSTIPLPSASLSA